MSLPPAFTDDVSTLPTHAFSYRSVTWWGIIGFMVIEGMFFVLTIGAYFFLMSHEQGWAPQPWDPPNLVWGTLFTAVILASEIPNTMIKKAAEAYDTDTIRALMPWSIFIGIALMIIRGMEFNSLNVLWWENAYGSIIWALLLLHATHLATDWIDTVVLYFLMKTPHATSPRRLVDVDENSLYWRFVWLSWLPIYLLIYWVPRFFR
jgi:heme/copper-type cytochrome/quinol oxidase subunit 3